MTGNDIKHILSLGKENLLDILHYLSVSVTEITGCSNIRVYMEDMREGALICLYTSEGELERKGARIPIQWRENYLVRAFLASQLIDAATQKTGGDDLHTRWFSERSLTRSVIFPFNAGGRSIGVLSIDAQNGKGSVLSGESRDAVRGLFKKIMPVLEKAHRFHQQIMLNRHLDRSRKREIARILLGGAFELEMALDMTSVLIPAESTVPAVLRTARGGHMEILASASRDMGDPPVYETLERISLLEGKSLLSLLVMQDGDSVVMRPGAPDVLFFEDILSRQFERWDVFHHLSLRTLLMIPVMDYDDAVVCVVNYFTKRPHQYTEWDLGLLKNHAMALGRGIADTGEEHFEIKVLSEIEQLLGEDTELPVFLNKVVSMVVELVGADTGSIGLLSREDEQRWVVVDGAKDNGPSGAKSRGWRKAQIPLLKVGGEELPVEERSLTGYVAHTGKPFLCNDTVEEAGKGGFFKNLSSLVRSELAVPIVVGGSVIGVINLDSYQERYFNQEHQRIILLISRLIANRIADLIKISELTQKVARLKREVEYRDPAVSSYLLGNIIGKSRASTELVDRLGLLVPPLTSWLLNWDGDIGEGIEFGLPTLLITGETGSGKEFVFNNLYSLLNERYREAVGKREELPLRKTNIAAYGGDLTFSELFGHRKGAYTGAYADRKGIFDEADGGIVFLDEIGDADQKTQVQLLRFLDSGEFSRLGDSRIQRSRVIFVAATNKDLGKEIELGNFREDLYHRLREIVLKVPPLRERREDIPDLAKHFLGRLHSKFSRNASPPHLTPQASLFLTGLEYPGNIRQLVSILQGGLFESVDGSVGEQEIRKALRHFRGPGPDGDNASALYDLIRGGKGNFWDMIHAPFIAHDMTRSMVLRIYKIALAEGGGVKEAALLLRALEETPYGEQKALMRFKNFMYKTIGAGKSG